MQIEKAIVHESFYADDSGVWNDIALIKLKSPLRFNDAVQPACLPNEIKDKYPNELITIGWGSTNIVQIDRRIGGSIVPPVISRFLKEAEMYDHTDTIKFCEDKKETNICVFNEKTKETSCKGK